MGGAIFGVLTQKGAYPQSRVWDESIISSLESLSGPTINDWYLLDGNYYARLSATPRSSKSKFDDGEKIVTGQEYWFRCEPIEWKILSSSGGEYSLVSSKLLDTAMFNDIYDGEQVDGHYANNYAFSSIRSWLNGDFLTTAFPYENGYLETVEVDNSAATTDSSENVYACENTFDQVYLLSYQDYANATYFPDDNSRRCQTSEWARAKGANVYTSSGLNHTNYYYTRSPYSANPDYAIAIYPKGNFSYGSRTNYTQDSPRPGITIKIA